MKAQRKTILITGSSSGFGMLTAVALAKAGYKVYATMRNLNKQSALVKECEKQGVSVAIRALDVCKPETIAPVVAEMEKECEGVDVLINNAGFACGGFFEDVSQRNFEEQFATNFFGALQCTRAVLPGMRNRRRGLIINISSISGLDGTSGLSAYTSSKFALEGWSECLRYEVKPFGIYVTLVEPGTFKTEIFSAGNQKAGDNALNPASPYYKMYMPMQKNFLRLAERHGQNPLRVVKTIVKIVRTSRPRLRHLVGTDAKIEMFLKRLLPSSCFEKIMGAALSHFAKPEKI